MSDVTATYESGQAAPQQQPDQQPVAPQPRDNITLLPQRPRGGTGQWVIYAGAALLVCAAFALLLSLVAAPDETGGERRRAARRRTPWYDGLLDDEQGDADEGDEEFDPFPRGERRRTRRSSRYDGGREPQAAAPQQQSFMPPIIINTPSGQPTIFGGGGTGSKGD